MRDLRAAPCCSFLASISIPAMFGRATLARRASLVILCKSLRFPPDLSRRDHSWLATKTSKMSRSPSGLSRREHDLQATCVPTQSLLPPGQARRRAANAPGRCSVASWCSPPVVAPAGTGPTEASKIEMCKATSARAKGYDQNAFPGVPRWRVSKLRVLGPRGRQSPRRLSEN